MSDAKDKKVFRFAGEKVDALWDGRLCIHVGECTRAKGGLFESGRDPWGKPDEGEADYVAEVVRRCPSGALWVERKDGGAAESAPDENVAVIANNGPIYLSGDLDIDGAVDDMPAVRYRAALCRCGDSKNKPFCDNSHEKAGFVDRGAVGETGGGFESAGGPLEVSRAPNGPLLVNGNLTIRSAAGRPTWRGTKAALCRCGKSRNKPFCDGSHKDAGFSAD
jgi:CDGSH-type Zn-finger protein/uncharacterized Fe-S cluster protein YjdI